MDNGSTTLIGNLTSDPELRWTEGGTALATFTVASTRRVFDREKEEWRDGETLFMRCSLWRQPAERAVDSLRRGARVIVHGELKQRSYETREGEKRSTVELEVQEIGPSLRYSEWRLAGKVGVHPAGDGPDSKHEDAQTTAAP
jgi:single-strand DNA-binding protein